MNYSLTQGTNVTAFIAALTIFAPLAIKLFSSPLEMGADDWSQLGASGTVVVTSIVSFINRYKKGDITLVGNVKK